MKISMKRRFCGIFLILLLALSLAACKDSESTQESLPTETESSTIPPSAEDTAIGSLPAYGGALSLTLPKESEGTPRASLKIVIDAGHGQRDPGVIVDSHNESDINLALSLRLASLLKEMGYDVMLIRHDDTALLGEDPNYDTDKEADARREAALAAGADLYLSIHCNADSSSAKGTRMFYHSRVSVTFDGRALALNYASALNQTFAARIRDGETPTVRDNYLNGMRDPYIVLKDKHMPALLFEIGFMTSPDDLRLLTDSDYLWEYAYALALGTDEARTAELFGTK